jgi:hypothetical protein
MMYEVDETGDGRLDLDEFLTMMGRLQKDFQIHPEVWLSFPFLFCHVLLAAIASLIYLRPLSVSSSTFS